MKIAIAGGVTGGHLFPALSVAEALQQRGHQLLYLGTQHGLEAQILRKDASPMPETGRGVEGSASREQSEQKPLPFHLFEMSGLRSTRRTLWSVPFTLWRVQREAYQVLRAFKPELLFTTGGYPSVPIAMAAQRLRVPLVLLEPDAYPGKANLWLARRAQTVCLNFEECARYLPRGTRWVRTGLPIRKEVVLPEVAVNQARAHLGLKTDRFTVLVVGGSQGAQALNESVLNTVQHLPSGELQWLHITGVNHYELVRDTANRLGLNGNYRPVPFLTAREMGLAYRACDVVLARAGASSLTEFAVNALPMILVPYPHSAGGHQRYNCLALVERGACVMVEQQHLSPQVLSHHLLALRDCPDQRRMMGQRAREWVIPDATERIVSLIEALALPGA